MAIPPPPPPPPAYPVNLSVEYPDRPLDRLSTAFRIFVAIPIMIVLGAVSGTTWSYYSSSGTVHVVAGAGGLLFFGPLLMILFRQKYPRWWFDWNLELQRFTNRVGAYVAAHGRPVPVDHRSTVGAPRLRLSRRRPRTQPVASAGEVAAGHPPLHRAWRSCGSPSSRGDRRLVRDPVHRAVPEGIFDFVEGVIRWNNRVIGYAFTLVTDRYPPFSLRP